MIEATRDGWSEESSSFRRSRVFLLPSRLFGREDRRTSHVRSDGELWWLYLYTLVRPNRTPNTSDTNTLVGCPTEGPSQPRRTTILEDQSLLRNLPVGADYLGSFCLITLDDP